jgi:hypothetical protein
MKEKLSLSIFNNLIKRPNFVCYEKITELYIDSQMLQWITDILLHDYNVLIKSNLFPCLRATKRKKAFILKRISYKDRVLFLNKKRKMNIR